MKFYIFIFIVVIGVLLIFDTPQSASPPTETGNIELRNTTQRIYQLMSSGDYDLAEAVITPAIFTLERSAAMNSATLAWLYEMKATIMAAKYHYHHAITAISAAAKHQDEPRYKQQKLDWQQQIDSMQKERLLKESYRNSRHAGLSKTLTKQVNIAYIYIDDNASSKWSGKQRLRNQSSIDSVTNWYQTQASRYSVDDINFKVRYFVVRSPKGISKQWLRNRESFNQILNSLVKRMHFKNIDGFINNIAASDKNAQVAIVFHSNYQGRSFAMSCPASPKPNRCKYEYVMLTEKMNNNHFSWVLPQIQAHEVLHLFGAKDLYNIRGAKNYAVTDVMNYYSKDLKYATIDPLSAWAIGWQQQQPTPPFKIEN